MNKESGETGERMEGRAPTGPQSNLYNFAFSATLEGDAPSSPFDPKGKFATWLPTQFGDDGASPSRE